MRFAIRADASPKIGGGHVMRCLALAEAARAAGHEVIFLCADVAGHLGARISDNGFEVLWLTPGAEAHAEETVETWRAMPVAEDAQHAAALLANTPPDWIILDHYGLGGAWVKSIRQRMPCLRIMALDDLDAEPLFADLLLNPAAFDQPHRQPQLGMLKGPDYALLRPEFAALRPAALARRNTPPHKVLILPGMMDAGGLAPAALTALKDFPDLSAEVIMGASSQSLAAVEAMAKTRPEVSLVLDAKDMAARMRDADLCIGAGGGTAWERCCLGLPSVTIAVSDNQRPGIDRLSKAGAAVGLGPEALTNPALISEALKTLMADAAGYSEKAAALCDGQGAARVVAALSGQLRPLTETDIQTVFDWRNQSHIRAASLTTAPLVWDDHLAYLTGIITHPGDRLWRIYQEAGHDLGLVNARPEGDGIWRWGFYIGAAGAPNGAGRRMLIAFLRLLLEQPDLQEIRATVRRENTKSITLHKTLGFSLCSDTSAPELDFQQSRQALLRRLGFEE